MKKFKLKFISIFLMAAFVGSFYSNATKNNKDDGEKYSHHRKQNARKKKRELKKENKNCNGLIHKILEKNQNNELSDYSSKLNLLKEQLKKNYPFLLTTTHMNMNLRIVMYIHGI